MFGEPIKAPIKITEELRSMIISLENSEGYRVNAEDIMEALQEFSSGKNIDSIVNAANRPLLDLLIQCNRGEVARFWVEELGASVNSRDSLTGFSPLHSAVRYHQRGIIPFLIKHGADVKAHCPEFGTPEEMAVSLEKVDNGVNYVVYAGIDKLIQECCREEDSSLEL